MERLPFKDLFADDIDARYQAYRRLLKATDSPVTWSYQIWDELVAHLAERFREAAAEKSGTLVRYDIVISLKKLADATGVTGPLAVARECIALEEDPKYAKKYLGVLK